MEQNISRGLFVAKNGGFRPNRGIREGNYLRTFASLDFNPGDQRTICRSRRWCEATTSVRTADYGGSGLELRTAMRRELGPFQLYARGDGGRFSGRRVPQAMFEIGSGEGLSAYGYKEFAGDHAAILGRRPWLHVAVSPSADSSPEQSHRAGNRAGTCGRSPCGWTEVSGAAAQAALIELGTRLIRTPGCRSRFPAPPTECGAIGGVPDNLFQRSACGRRDPTRSTLQGPWKFTARHRTGILRVRSGMSSASWHSTCKG